MDIVLNGRGASLRTLVLSILTVGLVVVPSVGAPGAHGTVGGACCLDDATCVTVIDETSCDMIEGTYQGDGTDCGTTVCPLSGACCAPDATSCANAATEGDCLATGGVFQGVGTTCQFTICQIYKDGKVDIRLEPLGEFHPICDVLELNLLVSSPDAIGQPFDVLDVILTWDPAILELIGLDDSGTGGDFFISAFLADPDGVNSDLGDGDGIYSALAVIGQPVTAPPEPAKLLVTTLQFRVKATDPATEIAMPEVIGAFGETRALIEGFNVTGDIGDAVVLPVGSCQADIDGNGNVGFNDLLLLLVAWGPCSGCCPEDLTGDYSVGFADLVTLLANWGPCP